MRTLRLFDEMIEDHIHLLDKVAQIGGVEASAEQLVKTLKNGNKILVCGNGGSAADSQHFAAELIGGIEKRREPLPALALTANPSILTAVGNDYGFDSVFEKQVKCLGRAGDVLVGISTSGNSANVLHAVGAAKERKMMSIGLLGKDGGKLGALVDIPVVVPHVQTARIQEVHIFILHFWSAFIERQLFPE
jgi:D-sedoheptulose 7-phosphate isomerase